MARKSNLNAQRQAPNTLIRGSIDTLTQGISQQPPHLRQVGQGEKQINGWSSPVSGLQKRRPTIYVNRLSSTPIEDFYLETMPVKSGERYQVFIYPSSPDKVRMSIVNNGKPVNIDVHGHGLSLVDGMIEGTNSSYLYNSADLAHGFVFFNNGPLGMLLNRRELVAMDPALSPAQPHEAIIFVQSVAYEITYTVNLNGTDLPVYTTPKATDTDNLLSVNRVAQELVARINAVSGFQASHVDGVIWIKKSDGSDFTLGFSDSRSNALGRSFKKSTVSFAGLPLIAPNGFILKVENSPDSTVDDYWIKFRTRDGEAFGEGSWVETVAPGIQYKLDPNTMPLVIYRKTPDTFFVGPADGATRSKVVNGTTETFTFPSWGEREAGDEITVPPPSFVNRYIQDHGIYRSRYVVLAGENIVMSRVDEVFNFFMRTSTQVLDTDPIDLLSVSETSSRLYWMLPVDESLLVFGAKSQFQVRPVSADVLTPRNAVCTRLSNIEMNINLRPRLCGANIVFGTFEYGYSGFREYQFIDEQVRRIGLNIGSNSSITLTVPKLIPGQAEQWDVGESEDYFVCMTPDMGYSLYVYKFLWANSSNQLNKLQSSWSEWTFDGHIRWVRFIDGELYIVMTYTDGTYTVKIKAEEGIDSEQPMFYLDRKIRYPECNSDGLASTQIIAEWDEQSNTTTFTLPYIMNGTTDAVIRWDNNRSQLLQIGTWHMGNKIICLEAGDWRNDKIVFGRRYLFEYEFSRFYKPVTDQSRQRIVGDLNGRLQIATLTIHHTQTGRYDVIVTRRNRAKDTRHQFWARVLNVKQNELDATVTPLQRGSFRVPIYSRNTDCVVRIESRSWLPLTISGASWEGTYSDRARSIN